MAFYENTIVLKQDLATKDLEDIKEKYKKIISDFSGKVFKIEDWGLLSLTTKIKNYNKGFFIHYKFEGSNKTLNEFEKKIKLEQSIIRHLIVKYKKLDVDKEYFKKD